MRWLRAHSASPAPAHALCLVFLAGFLTTGCRDYDIKEGDSPQIIALKKKGAKVSATLPGTLNVDLLDTWIDDGDLVHFEELPEVYSVKLSGTDVTDEGLKHLAVGPKKLAELFLENTEVTDAGIESLNELSQLKILDLSGTKITDKGLELIAQNQRGLYMLTLTGCDQITNDGLKSVAQLKRLENLILTDNKQITDDGIKHLMGRPLKLIHLYHTGCSNAAVEKLANSTGAPIVVNANGDAAGALAKMIQQ